MKQCAITDKAVRRFKNHLISEERSANTISKYLRDISNFCLYLGDNIVTKKHVIEYKKHLEISYEASSINSMLASLNSLFSFLGWQELRVKQLKVQKRIFCSEDKELTRKDYEKLIWAAKQKSCKRLNLVIQTIANTGIRVSELKNITVCAVKQGRCEVHCKGKVRTIFIPKELRRLLIEYINETGIEQGPVFITRTGKPLNRTNIWREMKNLCRVAGVSSQKVFPHNLRHMFARLFNDKDDNIVKLANILGHTSIDTTRIYTISSGREYAKQISALRLVIE